MAAGLRAVVWAAGLAAAGYWPVRLAWADLCLRSGDLACAVRLVPGNAEYQLRAGDAAAAAALNPYAARAWIELGLEAEARSEPARAERLLLEAAGRDRTFGPAWTLASFYFRQKQSEKLWSWGRRAAELGSARQDLTPLFRLYWRASDDPRLILERGVPLAPDARRKYLAFLIGEKRPEAARALAEAVAARAAAEDLPVLLDHCDQQLALGRSPLQVWNRLCERGLLRFEPLDPQRGRVLTNPRFAIPASRRGFDWRLESPPGVSIRQTSGGLTVTLSGEQPETCELLWQYAPALPGRGFRIRTEPELPPGFSWSIAEAGPEVIRLALVFARAPGTTRFEGAVTVARVGVELE